MTRGILSADGARRGLVLDPRTKLLLLVTMAVFVLGGAGFSELAVLPYALSALPLVLLLSARRYRPALVYAAVYLAAEGAFRLAGPLLTGPAYFILLGTRGILTRFLPSLMMGAYVVSTTTVSEFTAAMLRLRLSEAIIIPMSVMFRFFPTVADEFSSINAAMRMRGIALGGGRAGKMLEYRMIPLITCSVKIGEELSAAALTRGLGGTVRRTNVCEIGFHRQDAAAAVLCALPFGALALCAAGIW